MPNEIPAVFHNGSKCDYYFIIKELANDFECPFECVGENSEMYKSFSVPIKIEVIKNNKDETISCKIKFIDSIRFISSSLTHHFDNLFVIKTVNLNLGLKELKITNFFMIVKSVEKNSYNQ